MGLRSWLGGSLMSVSLFSNRREKPSMAAKRKPDPDQPNLPIPDLAKGNGGSRKPKPAKNGNGETHVLAENVAVPVVPHLFKPDKIDLALHRRVDRSFLDYASYVIRDRAIPNVADGLK